MNNYSKRRLTENEVLFRKANEEIQQAAKDYMAPSEQKELMIEFYCECSNMNCRERVVMTPDQHIQTHVDPKRFVLKPGHETSDVEEILEKSDHYIVVKKYLMPQSQGAS
jgi:hypothetical protein